MVTAIILLKVQRDQINTVAQKMVELDGVSEVYSVSGRYDLIGIIRVPNNDGLATLVTKQMIDLPGILDTETMLAFKAFSRHDLASMFSIGLED
ncbi:MAG: Lrp/AsnC ligand binding domain-containing protein [Anaerolineales bacterium]|nr:Lrp/AsnC ligand binding domain-containing protein [Anaerolineales bacterium]